MNLVDLLAEHAWVPATQRCMCGADVTWGAHPVHLADVLTLSLPWPCDINTPAENKGATMTDNLALACELARRYHLDVFGVQALLIDHPELVEPVTGDRKRERAWPARYR